MRPTILQVIPALDNGGVEIEAIEIAKAIVAAGGRALIASRKGRLEAESLASGIEFKHLPLDTKNPFQIYKNSTLLQKLIIKENVDIVHVRSRAPAWSAYRAAHSLGIPFVTTYHAAYSSHTIFKTFYNSVMAKGDRIIAISQFIKDHLIEKYSKFSWFDPSKIRLIQRGIDYTHFDPLTISDESLQQLRNSWEVPPTARLLLLPGRISRTKGQDLLIKALALMKHTDVMAIFVGSALRHESYRNNLLRLASKLNLEDRVKWVPPYANIPIAYQLADIIVCPSLVPEGFGRLMAEAQAMQKPIIASNHGAARELIDNGVTGWLTPPGDAKTLAKTLDHALDLPQKQLDEMGEKGRNRVKHCFSQEEMSSKTIAVYKELLNEKNPL
ncbi:MAG: glycosyltransferase family 4 protein [Alphaproteobacteria bacterium]|nr:glycosyltransferase family 4 protein [Alphaproteobacteria bacterium]